MSTTDPQHRHLAMLYSDHHGWLKTWLRGKLGCAADAADLAQDTFLRLLNRDEPAAAMQGLRQPRAYLTRIAQGLVIDHWRRRDVERAYLDALAGQPEAQAPSPETRALIIETLVRMDAALDALKPRTREAFLLAQLEGMSGPAIAERLGVSLATVERDLNAGWQQCYRVYFL
ncbi:sigma-70 family RNA polymerase sigma factor [Herbaspirillum sp. WKF16]|jgi:RNA polymerase sigma-70 factor (ECF subfamily)|uniref:sigma-70 family RNA polymerase sigma factor n=1 Tax=Herbaspirillum sp. WKF16 TaxID=3028312 RepID=UPI0023A9991D|nr:sigma-70 family RNA polymerase sigma factor [Herbaspirillum sp. WKF16]WDZ94911.1 sigma-70 family RNA polymerase sigma factor [Herbaspirillum sp. WKF16]